MRSRRPEPRRASALRAVFAACVISAVAQCATYSVFATELFRAHATRDDIQADHANLERYWRYRVRLVTEFLDPGEGPGKHIPADTIYIRGRRVDVIRWADGPLQLGWYIGVLALETAWNSAPDSIVPQLADRIPKPAAVAAREEENVADIPNDFPEEPVHLRELYFALAAIDRLDRRAEPIFARVCAGPADDVPGFFIRDDVEDSPELRARMGRLWIESDFATLAAATCRAGMNGVRDCLEQCPHCFNGEASQDQIYHLLMGLALVQRFVPPGTSVRGVDLHVQAGRQARRMIDYLALHDWELRNPVCDRPVRRGSYAKGYSHATSHVAEYFGDPTHRESGSACLWTGAGWSRNPVYVNPDNRHLAMVLAATGGVWGPETFDQLTEMAEPEDWQVYPLLHLALNANSAAVSDEQRLNLRERVEILLDTAPEDGPAFDGPPRPNPGWSSSNRFLRGRAKQQGAGESYGALYNGLDYLLLYGLSRVAFD